MVPDTPDVETVLFGDEGVAEGLSAGKKVIDGQTAKVANQIIVALTIGAVSEGLLFASKAGADPANTGDARPAHDRSELRAGVPYSLHQKDINNALDAARSLNMSLPSTALAQELFNVWTAQGHGELDYSALIRALNQWRRMRSVPERQPTSMLRRVSPVGRLKASALQSADVSALPAPCPYR